MLVLNRTTRSFDARMMAMASRLFTDYDRLPVSTVLGAISAARRACRDICDLSDLPDEVERRARAALGTAPLTPPSRSAAGAPPPAPRRAST